MLVDSHCHLEFPDFAAEIDEVVARARQAGVGLMLTIGTRLSRSRNVIAVAEAFSDIFATVGTHPHHVAEECGTDLSTLIAQANHPKVVGVGESGLDFFYDFSPRAQQEESFRVHIAAARQLGLPIVIHSRDADDDMIRILREEMEKGPFTGLMHCYSSGPELAAEALRLGLYLSASGVVTFKKSDTLRDIFRTVPMDRLLLETDSPYLAPTPKRGKRNEPAYVVLTAKVLADVKGVSVDELAQQTTQNFLTLFSRVPAKGEGE